MKTVKKLLNRKPQKTTPSTPKAKDPNAPTPGLEQAKTIFKALANVGDGAVNVPGLKAAAQLVVQIIEVVEADYTVVAERACQLVQTAADTVAGVSEQEIGDRLKLNLGRLHQQIYNFLSEF